MILALVALSGMMLFVRLAAARIVGFGDSEALYACYALHPKQAAFLDHPGLIGVLAHALGGGTAPGTLAAHTATAVAATLAPWLVVLAARAAGASWQRAGTAGLAVAVVPEIAIGLFAMSPDLLLFVAWVAALGLAAWGLSGAPGSPRAASCLVLAGLASGVACAAKVSGVTLVIALAITYLSRRPEARAHAKTAWPWLGLAAGLVVVVPIAAYEARTGWPMLRHRLIDTQAGAGLSLRNAGGLLLGQLAYLSPLVAIVAAMIGRDLWRVRRRSLTSTLLWNATVVPFVVLAPLCLWSRVAEPHWLAPALLALPLHLAARMTEGAVLVSRRFALATVASAAAFSALAHAWVLMPQVSALAPASYDPRFDIANELYGWPEVATGVRRMASEEHVPLEAPGSVVVVGPHWVVCAQLHALLHDELPVGCAGPQRDDFDDWFPKTRWEHADTLIYVTDNRFPDPDFAKLFPDRTLKRQTRLRIFRGGKVARLFTLTVLEVRGAA